MILEHEVIYCYVSAGSRLLRVLGPCAGRVAYFRGRGPGECLRLGYPSDRFSWGKANQGKANQEAPKALAAETTLPAAGELSTELPARGAVALVVTGSPVQ